jgi:hypothetical protein
MSVNSRLRRRAPELVAPGNLERRLPSATSRLTALGRLATSLLQAACLPPRREGAQTMRRVRRVSPLPNLVPLINPDLRELSFRSDGSTPPRWLRGARRGAVALSRGSGAGHAATSRKHRMRCRALTLLFDQPLKGVPRSPGKTSASFARWCAPGTSPGLSDGRACRSSRAGWLNGTRCGVPFLVRVAGIVQVAKSSESSAHVIPATSSRRWPVSINRRTMARRGASPRLARAAVIQRAVVLSMRGGEDDQRLQLVGIFVGTSMFHVELTI